LADLAGIQVHWRDAHDLPKTVAPDVLRTMLKKLGIAAGTDAEIADSLGRIERDRAKALPPPMLTADVGQPIRIPLNKRQRYRIRIENSGTVEGEIDPDAQGFGELPGIGRIGYHTLEIGNRSTMLAVAPPRCFTIDDIGARHPSKLSGIAVQLY